MKHILTITLIILALNAKGQMMSKAPKGDFEASYTWLGKNARVGRSYPSRTFLIEGDTVKIVDTLFKMYNEMSERYEAANSILELFRLEQLYISYASTTNMKDKEQREWIKYFRLALDRYYETEGKKKPNNIQKYKW